MDALVIGEGSLTLHKVAKVVEKSSSFAALQTRWRSFAIYVGVNEAELPGLDARISSGALHLKDVPREILKMWKADKGEKAVMKKLCKALDQCHLNDIADALKAKFCPVHPEKQVKLILQEKVYTLEQIFKNNVPKEITQIIRSNLETHATTRPILIIRNEVCPLALPLYYIPRTLSYRNILDEKIFRADSTKEHIFLVKGSGKPELARASGFKEIERSGNQLKKVTVHHILLEHDDDFHTICKITRKPVHMIEFTDNSFLHLRSSAGMDEIQTFIKQTGVSFGEEEAVQRIEQLQSPFAISIADSPGMGKSFVLAKLSALIKENNPNSIILIIVLQELAQNFGRSKTHGAVLEAISTYSTSNNLTNIIFQEILKSNNHQFYLFLDGYDEVVPDKLDSVDVLIQQLINFPNLKVIVTTRPHLKSRLENILHRLSFQIQPFDESSQIEFLIKYWSNMYEAKSGKMLEAFAQKCLQLLKMTMTSKEKDIVGIPLQCSMLAEVYAEQAIRASKLESLPEDVVKIDSFFEIYKSLMDLKFKRIGNSEELRQKYFDAHVHDAIVLLFPHRLAKFKAFLSPRNEVEESVMYSIGLVEKCPSSNAPRFLHRTFTENLLAHFIVGKLFEDSASLQFLYKEILGSLGTTLDERRVKMPTMYHLKHPVIAYFVEMYLRDRFLNKGSGTNKFQFLNALDLTNISDEDVCIAANVCCSYDLENCFDLTQRILKIIDIKSNLKSVERNFKELPHLVIEMTENVSLLKKVLNFTKMEFQVKLHWHVFKGFYHFDNYLEILDCTPLHVATYHGKYNMVTCLLEEYGQDVLSIKYLMHCCLIKSAYNRDSVIEEKLSIIESLAKKNQKWLVEDFKLGKPILQKDAHVMLIKKLVQLGVDINTYSQWFGSILHHAGDSTTYIDLVGWALNNGFILINDVDGDGRTPLMLAIKRFKIVSDDVLQLFNDAGANFNAQDEHGDSVLFHAIQWTRNVEFVKKILAFGGNHSYRTNGGKNAAHLVIENNGDDPDRAIELLQLLLSKGFNGLHQKKGWGNTPVRQAIKKRILNDAILKYFTEAGADEDGNSALFHSIQYRLGVDVIQKILNFGGNVNNRNKKGENAAHLIIDYNKDDPFQALELLQLILSSGFNGLHQEDEWGCTPFQYSIGNGMMTDEILKCFVEAGADEDGNSVLFHALKYIENTELIQKLLNFGENVNHRNNAGENAAHFVIRYQNKNPQLALDMLKMLETNGFKGFNKMNLYWQTPSRLAKRLRIEDEELSNYLKDMDSFCLIQ